ncbi:hypothetical protein IAU59_004766 [Kwoniella sp. CBS 9459]
MSSIVPSFGLQTRPDATGTTGTESSRDYIREQNPRGTTGENPFGDEYHLEDLSQPLVSEPRQPETAASRSRFTAATDLEMGRTEGGPEARLNDTFLHALNTRRPPPSNGGSSKTKDRIKSAVVATVVVSAVGTMSYEYMTIMNLSANSKELARQLDECRRGSDARIEERAEAPARLEDYSTRHDTSLTPDSYPPTDLTAIGLELSSRLTDDSAPPGDSLPTQVTVTMSESDLSRPDYGTSVTDCANPTSTTGTAQRSRRARRFMI